ncbi:MAG: NAD(P)/FAD-dependent oxidoreductase, partial [Planctomycetota bacterium]
GGLCGGEEVVVVGGGNSAGQAAVYLSSVARKVWMLVRGEGLAASMSDYLIRRIDAARNIELLCRTQVTALDGDDCLRRVDWARRDTGSAGGADAAHLFLMIGAAPNTEWLGDAVAKDDRGFICTGTDLIANHAWSHDRPPQPFETSLPRVFAVGDARSGSVKRVASAVGEGSVCVQFVHRALAAGG